MPSIDRDFADEPARLETAAPHPEEMKATIDLRIGRALALTATARATPAGLVATAMLVAAIVVPSVWLMRSRR